MSQITDMLARLRSVINETSAGFNVDATDLYPYLDSGQNLGYESLLREQKQMRMIKDPYYEGEALKSLLKSNDIASGVKAYIVIAFTTPTGELTFTAISGGTDGNNIAISYDDTASGAVEVSTAYTTSWVITVNWKGGTSTCQDIINAVNAHAVAKTLVLGTTTTPTALILTTGRSVPLANGTASANFILPTDLIEIHSVELAKSTGIFLPITYIPLSYFRKMIGDSYKGHNYDSTLHKGEVLCALNSATTIITSFTTWDTYWDYLRIYYYGKPTTISASTGCLLPPQCYEAIIEFAAHYVCIKAKDYQRAGQHLQKGMGYIQGL